MHQKSLKEVFAQNPELRILRINLPSNPKNKELKQINSRISALFTQKTALDLQTQKLTKAQKKNPQNMDIEKLCNFIDSKPKKTKRKNTMPFSVTSQMDESVMTQATDEEESDEDLQSEIEKRFSIQSCFHDKLVPNVSNAWKSRI